MKATRIDNNASNAIIHCIDCSDILPVGSRCPCKANTNEEQQLLRCTKCVQKRLRGKLFKRSLLQKKLSDMRERARSVLTIEHNNGTSPISIDQKSNDDLEKLGERVEEMQGKVNEVIK